MVGDCLHAIHWLRTAADHPHLLRAPSSGTDEEPRDVHQPVQGSPQVPRLERDPHSTSLPPGAEGPDRGRRMMETSGGLDVSARGAGTCTTSGRPPKLVRALAILLGKLFNQRFHWHLHLLPHFHGRGHLMRELANRRTMHGLVVGARTCPTPTSPE